MNVPSKPIGVLIVDDHPLLRDGLAAMLGNQADMALVGEADNGEDALHRYEELHPDIVLMDLQMPRLDGVQATLRIRQLDPAARIIILTTYSGDVRAVRALEAGACAYLLKDTLRKELVDTIRHVHNGKLNQMPNALAQSIAAHVAHEQLSPREIEVLAEVAHGRSNKAIALRMDISEQTVKAHMKNILGKLGARDRTHAVTLGLQRGIIALDA